MITQEQINNALKVQSNITLFEIATFCANLCDKHRGHLQVGEMIRQHFNLVDAEKNLPKGLNLNPASDVNFEKPVKNSFLSVVKKGESNV